MTALPIQPGSSEDCDSFERWFQATLRMVEACDYDGAARAYAPQFDSPFWFGNLEPNLTHGFEETRDKQWKRVWPRASSIELAHNFELHTSADRLWAVAAGTISFKDRADGDNVGTRITYVLVRAAIGEPWNAVHAHHSADPRFPARLEKLGASPLGQQEHT